MRHFPSGASPTGPLVTSTNQRITPAGRQVEFTGGVVRGPVTAKIPL
jgi:hypothetical protein